MDFWGLYLLFLIFLTENYVLVFTKKCMKLKKILKISKK